MARGAEQVIYRKNRRLKELLMSAREHVTDHVLRREIELAIMDKQRGRRRFDLSEQINKEGE